MRSSNRAATPGMALGVGALALFQTGSTIPWWVWLLLVIVLVILVYMILRGGRKEAAPQVVDLPPAAVVKETPAVVIPDDLTKVEGIGPKINQLLQDAGIQTFAQLAATDVEKIQSMLTDANLRLAKPTTWPEQARLASAGEWDALQKLQDELKGGRLDE